MPPGTHHLFLPAVVTGAGGVVGVDGRETGGGRGKQVLYDSRLDLCIHVCVCVCASVCACVCRQCTCSVWVYVCRGHMTLCVMHECACVECACVECVCVKSNKE